MELFRSRILAGAALVWLMVCGPLSAADPVDTNSTSEPLLKAGTNQTAESDLQLRTYLKLQEQLHVTLQAIESARQESSQDFRTNADALAQRLELLEQSLAR